LEERAKTLASEKQAQNEALQEARKANEELTNAISEFQKELAECEQTHESLFRIGKLSICKVF
jgi:chromosome segregation ATPase